MENNFIIILCFTLSLFLIIAILFSSSMRIVREDARLSVYRLGRYIGDKGPGIVILIPLIDRGVIKELGEVGKSPSNKYVGIVGETRTTVYTNGKVFVAGEEWDAISQTPISAGQRVRVVKMVLEVEKE